MDNIELKHLAPYLPYGLRILRDSKVMELCGLSSPYKTNNNYFVYGETKVVNGTYRQTCSFMIDKKHSDTFKPILRPMSDIGKVIAIGSEQIRCSSAFDLELDNNGIWHDRHYADQCESPTVDIPVTAMNMWLFEYHFDVFGLIEKELAIDINVLNHK